MRQCRPGVLECLCSELHDIKEVIKKCCCEIKNKECICRCECDCNGGGGDSPCCCAASVCAQGAGNASTETIPAGSCITQIFASFISAGGQGDAKSALIEITSGERTIFCRYFTQENPFGGSYDTTFIPPLCVDEDAVATITALPQGQGSTTDPVTITIAYCPNCCDEPAPPKNGE